MGRFFNSTAGNYIDYTYQPPIDLILEAVHQNDAQIDATTNQALLLGNELIKIPFLEQDKERVEQITSGYSSKIDEITESLAKNPADWRKQTPTLKALSRTIFEDYTKGELAGIQQNYSSYQNWLKANKERVNKGEILPDEFNKIASSILSEYKGYGYDPSSKTGTSLNAPDLYKYVDINKKFEEYTKGIKPNILETKSTNIGQQWLVETEQGKKWFDKKQLTELISNKAATDQELQGFLRQRYQYGVIDDVDSLLNNALEGELAKFSNVEQTSKTSVKPNQWGLQNDAQDFQARMQKDRQAFAQQQQEDKQLHDFEKANYNTDEKLFNQLLRLKQQEVNGDVGASEALQLLEEKIQSRNTKTVNVSLDETGSINVYPFNNEQKQPKYETLLAQNISFKDDLKELQQEYNNESDPSRKARLNERMLHLNNALNNNLELTNTIQNYATGKIRENKKYNPEDVTLIVSSFLGNTQAKAALDQRIRTLEKKSQQKVFTGGGVDAKFTDPSIIEQNRNAQSAEKELSYLNNIQKDYKQYMNDWVKENSESLTYKVSNIKTDANVGKTIINNIQNRGHDFEIIDPNTGKEMSATKFSEGFFNKKYQMSFGGSGSNGTIFEWMNKKGLTLNDVVNVESINNPIAGYGTTATVKLKNIPNVDSNQKYIITLPDDVAVNIASNIKTKNPTNKTVLDNIVKTKKANLYNELTDKIGDIPLTTTVINPQNNNYVNIKVSPKVVAGKKEYIVEYLDSSNSYKYLDSYNSIQELVDNVYKTDN